MRSKIEYDQVLLLLAQESNQSEIARKVGIPRGTVAEWIRKQKDTKSASKRTQCELRLRFREWSRDEVESYCYLLGLYLGDGCIDKLPRTYRLRIFVGSNEYNIIDRATTALKLLFPHNKINVSYPTNEKMVIVYCHSNLLPEFFPQTGDGSKSDRNVSLIDWQREAVEITPGAFVEGLFHSDGCFDANYTKGVSYPRYSFSNTSADIISDLAWALGLLGITPRIIQRAKEKPTYKQQQVVYVARRKDVEKLNAIIENKNIQNHPLL